MLNKTNSLVTLAVILAVLGVSKPAKAIVRDRSDAESATFSVSNESLAAQPRIDKASNNSRVTVSQADVNVDTVQDNNPVNGDLEDSGSINSDLEDSGAVNSDLEGSGEIDYNFRDSGAVNSDLESSGEIDYNFRDSGAVNSDLESSGEIDYNFRDSGAVNSDLEDSGKPFSTDDLDLEDESAISQREIVAPNDAVEGETPGTEIAEKKGSWWWWLIPLLGIPLLALIIALNGRKKNDREPAIGNLANPDAPGDGGLTPVVTDLSGNLNNVSGNAATATSRRGGTVARGATAANLVGNRPRTRTEEPDIDLDLESTDAVREIPSDSVSEFTGQESRLVSDRPNELQTKSERDFDPLDFESDSTAQRDVAVGLGGVAASESLVARKTTPLTDEDDAVSPELNKIDSTETTAAKEFRGDYVLEEETNKSLTSKLNAPATSEFSNQELNTPQRSPVDEFSLEEADNVIDLRQSEDNPSETAEAASATSDIDLSLDDDEDSVTNYATQGGIALGSATASGLFDREKLPAQQNVEQSEFSELDDVPAETNRDASDLNNVQAAPEVPTEHQTIRATLNPEASFDGADFSLEVITFDNPESSIDFSVDDITSDNSDRPSDTSLKEITDELENSIDSTVDSDDDASSVSLQEITFDKSDSIDFSTKEFTLDESDRPSNTSFKEITFDELKNSTDLSLDDISLDESDRPNDSSLEEITFDESDSSIDSIVYSDDDISNVSLDDITFDESESTPDLSLDEITLDESDRALDSSLEEITFDESQSSSDLSFDDITFDESESTPDLSLDEITLDESDRALDSSLEEITFDESDSSIDSIVDSDDDISNVSLDEITFDESESTPDLSLDDISFDESDRSLDTSIDEITFDESQSSIDSFIKNIDTADNDRIDLDDLGFEESESKDDSSLDLLSDNTADIASLSDENFDDIDNISEWLDSLQTPRQDSDTDNISEWLDTLDTADLDSAGKDSNNDNTMELNEESDDVSFQFLEDLLERDSNSKDEKQ